MPTNKPYNRDFIRWLKREYPEFEDTMGFVELMYHAWVKGREYQMKRIRDSIERSDI